MSQFSLTKMRVTSIFHLTVSQSLPGEAFSVSEAVLSSCGVGNWQTDAQASPKHPSFFQMSALLGTWLCEADGTSENSELCDTSQMRSPPCQGTGPGLQAKRVEHQQLRPYARHSSHPPGVMSAILKVLFICISHRKLQG